MDPAWHFVRTFADSERLSMLTVESWESDRSLKCNSLVHAFQSIDDPVVVLVDADTIPDPNWLADLVAPLREEDVVACSGNRWFVPPRPETGTLVISGTWPQHPKCTFIRLPGVDRWL